ncbi:c-type cytochrome [Ignavibacterium sp.]|uniref:c-type cytochrome n=1 Tax=Ignavibacterium sp. TaxID=2651167 RepID=UPI00307D1EEC
MEFLDNLVLPQSAEHIQLLHYMLMLILFLFIPFISIVFGGTVLSYLYKRKFNKEGKKEYLLFAKDTIKILPVNSLVGLILGVMSLLAVLLIMVQLLHKSAFPTVNDLALSFFLVSFGLISLYTYRITFALKLVFDSVKKDTASGEGNSDFDTYYQSTSKLSGTAVKFAILFLLLGMWIFTGALTTVIYFDAWKPSSFFTTIFSLRVLLNFVLWICVAFSFTGITLLFLFLFWKKDELNISEEYKNFVTSVSSKMSLFFSLPIPLLLLMSVGLLPDSHLSGTMFAYLILSIILLFLSLNFLYLVNYKKQSKYAPYLFFTFLFAVLFLIIKDQVTINNATKYHSVILSTEYEKILAELKGEGKGEIINAAELYQVRCGACHKFDQKLVGPAHFDVLPKYIGKEAQLVAFIRNPVKVDPAYPPMPNPGLKPAEAEAVAKYLLEEYQRLKQ